MNTTWSTTGSSVNLFYHHDDLGMKIANILAQYYLNKPEEEGHGTGFESYHFYNHDFYLIPENKVLRIRIDIVNQSKLFKKKKK